jgi:hypothetical protein
MRALAHPPVHFTCRHQLYIHQLHRRVKHICHLPGASTPTTSTPSHLTTLGITVPCISLHRHWRRSQAGCSAAHIAAHMLVTLLDRELSCECPIWLPSRSDFAADHCVCRITTLALSMQLSLALSLSLFDSLPALVTMSAPHYDALSHPPQVTYLVLCMTNCRQGTGHSVGVRIPQRFLRDLPQLRVCERQPSTAGSHLQRCRSSDRAVSSPTPTVHITNNEQHIPAGPPHTIMHPNNAICSCTCMCPHRAPRCKVPEFTSMGAHIYSACPNRHQRVTS